MSLLKDLYPPNPPDIPDEITKPTPAYQSRVVLVLACLFVFLIVYVAITASAAFLVYWSFSGFGQSVIPGVPRRGSVILSLVVGVPALLVFLYMVKGLFKRSEPLAGVEIEVTEDDQPVLFAFIRRVCHDTNAPFPHRVFLTHDVNACVAYEHSLWNLVWPMKKNLVIGLALVNRLNLSEFKAVLAHEFGHFSQNSMKLGNYVYIANTAIADIIYGRDWLDRTLDALCRIDYRITMLVYVLKGIVWVLRQFLGLIFKGINFASSALSRQMEFNADLVAFSVTGSDAIIHSLKKIGFATDTLMSAVNDLIHAGDHQLYTTDLYYHQNTSEAYLRRKAQDPSKFDPPPLSDDPTEPTQVFKPGTLDVPLMWATHPSNYDRELKVKEHYVRGVLDERSCWLLFQNARQLREDLTRQFYKKLVRIKKLKQQPAEEVQKFIDADHQEMTYDERYHGIYDEGVVGPGDLSRLIPEAGTLLADPQALDQMHADLFNNKIRKKMEKHRQRKKEQAELFGLASGFTQKSTFDFRGEEYPLKMAKKLLEEVNEEIEDDRKWMEKFDREVFKVHYAMALQLDPQAVDELERRYAFHLGIQDVVNSLQMGLSDGQALLNALGGKENPGQHEFQQLRKTLRALRKLLNEKLKAADELKVPEMNNMETGESLGAFLWEKDLPEKLGKYDDSISGEWVNTLFNAFREVIDRGRRIVMKSMGGILTLQDSIAWRWRTKLGLGTAPPPVPGSTTSPEEASAGAGKTQYPTVIPLD